MSRHPSAGTLLVRPVELRGGCSLVAGKVVWKYRRQIGWVGVSSDFQRRGLGMQDQDVDEFGLQVPRLIRIFREQDREWENREIGPPPVWDGNMKRSRIGVYGGPWPAWKRGLFHLTSAACFLPARLSDFD